MPEQVIEVLLLIARWLEIIGAAALILGFLIASINWVQRWTKEGSQLAGLEYRRSIRNLSSLESREPKRCLRFERKAQLLVSQPLDETRVKFRRCSRFHPLEDHRSDLSS